jgi:hypothetical protein
MSDYFKDFPAVTIDRVMRIEALSKQAKIFANKLYQMHEGFVEMEELRVKCCFEHLLRCLGSLKELFETEPPRSLSRDNPTVGV